MKSAVRSFLALVGLWSFAACSGEPVPPVGDAPQLTEVVQPTLPACVSPAVDSMFRVDTLARDLDVPWRAAVAPDGRVFVTERFGRLGVWRPESGVFEAWAEVPVFSGGEAGLMGLVLHPDFSENGELFAVGTLPRLQGLRGAIASVLPGRSGPRLVNRVLRFRDTSEGKGELLGQVGNDLPSGVLHAGAELRFGPDGGLFVSLGDGLEPQASSSPTSLRGTILRLDLADSETGEWEIYASGFRNVQGFDWNPDDGSLYAVDHGPTGMPKEDGRVDNDELNVVARASDHGWPWASGFQTYAGATPPVWGWTPATAPGALAFGTATPTGRDLWVGHLKRQAMSRYQVGPEGLRCEDWIFMGRFGRVRSVAVTADGSLYLTTANRSGQIAARPGDDLLLRASPLVRDQGGQ
ncbi:MAG: PQQ-dependent sugar dehydrogenase [Longimicrobiales bacterium]